MPKSINKVIKFLIAGDFFLLSGWGLLGPIFAIFIIQNITIGNAAEGAKVAGLAALSYWMVKSFLQIPISRYLDRIHGEKDDFWFMVLGLFITGLSPFGFLISFLPWHIYAFQILNATGMALFVPSWNAIFTRHIDKGKEAFEWGMDSTFLGLGMGITGAIGGIMVATIGFEVIFILVGTLTLFSCFLLLLIYKDILPTDHTMDHFFSRFRFLPFKKPKKL